MDAKEVLITSVSSKATQAGAGVTVFAWLTSDQALGAIGLFVGVVGLIINWHYKRKDDKRAQELHDKQMGEL
mgnify:CR=1 FL=1